MKKDNSGAPLQYTFDELVSKMNSGILKRNPPRREFVGDNRFIVIAVRRNETEVSDSGEEKPMEVHSMSYDSNKHIVLSVMPLNGELRTQITVLNPNGKGDAVSPYSVADVYHSEEYTPSKDNASMGSGRNRRKSRITRKKRKSTRRTRKH